MNTAKNKKICFYFQLHQPFRLSDFSIFDIETEKDYFTGPSFASNQEIFDRISDKCYIPMLNLMHRMSTEFEIKWSISMSGTWIEQAEKFRPDVIAGIQKLVKTGCLEILGETYYHSLSALKSKREFAEQVYMHSRKIRSTFALIPQVFRNTELIYNNDIANLIYEMGFDGMLAEGWNLGHKSPNFLYKTKKHDLSEGDKEIIDYIFHRIRKPKELKVLLRNYQLSDDIGFRFNDTTWSEYPLDADKFIDWIDKSDGDVVNLFMDLETFGVHQWEDTGIFEFLYELGKRSHDKFDWSTSTETIRALEIKDEIDVHEIVSWADNERDLSSWIGNKMQQNALDDIYAIEDRVKEAILYLRKTPDQKKLMDTWRKLQTSDHLHYMNIKSSDIKGERTYDSPYETPYQAFINYMNVLQDFRRKINRLSED